MEILPSPHHTESESQIQPLITGVTELDSSLLSASGPLAGSFTAGSQAAPSDTCSLSPGPPGVPGAREFPSKPHFHLNLPLAGLSQASVVCPLGDDLRSPRVTPSDAPPPSLWVTYWQFLITPGPGPGFFGRDGRWHPWPQLFTLSCVQALCHQTAFLMEGGSGVWDPGGAAFLLSPLFLGHRPGKGVPARLLGLGGMGNTWSRPRPSRRLGAQP